jgi:telomere length regulation protein
MDDLLTPISKTYLKAKDEEPFFTESKPSRRSKDVAETSTSVQISSPEQILEILKGEPDYDTVISSLQFLSKETETFSLTKPGPLSAQMTQVLVVDIAPNYWVLLKDATSDTSTTNRDLELLLECLRSITGINAIIVRLRALIQEHKSQPKGPKRSDVLLNIDILLQLLTSLLKPDTAAYSLWRSTVEKENAPMKTRALTHELVALLAGGRIVSVAAEADDILKQDAETWTPVWVGDGLEYSKWLGRSVVRWAKESTNDESVKTCSEVLTKALRLGYSGKSIATNRGLISDHQ